MRLIPELQGVSFNLIQGTFNRQISCTYCTSRDEVIESFDGNSAVRTKE
jgi:hypothetical protein